MHDKKGLQEGNVTTVLILIQNIGTPHGFCHRIHTFAHLNIALKWMHTGWICGGKSLQQIQETIYSKMRRRKSRQIVLILVQIWHCKFSWGSCKREKKSVVWKSTVFVFCCKIHGKSVDLLMIFTYTFNSVEKSTTKLCFSSNRNVAVPCYWLKNNHRKLISMRKLCAACEFDLLKSHSLNVFAVRPHSTHVLSFLPIVMNFMHF